VSEKDTFPVQVLIRTTELQRDRWRKAAEVDNDTVSAWIRDILDVRAAELLDCVHPKNERQVYQWQETCLRCGLRLRDQEIWLIPEVLR